MTDRVAVLRDAVEAFRGWNYSLRSVGYPWRIPGIRVPLVSDGAAKNTNCCHFVECVLARAWPSVSWTWSRHEAMMIIGDDRWGPVSAADVMGMGCRIPSVDAFAIAGPWRLCQGWRTIDVGGRRREARGHTFFVVRADERGLLILESNQARGVTGVGFRDVADLDALPVDWSFDSVPTSSRWTVESLREFYDVGVRAVALDV